MIAVDDLRILSELVAFHETEAKEVPPGATAREAAAKADQHTRYASELRRIILASRP